MAIFFKLSKPFQNTINQNSQNTIFEWFFVQTVSATFLQKSIKMKQFLFTWVHKVISVNFFLRSKWRKEKFEIYQCRKWKSFRLQCPCKEEKKIPHYLENQPSLKVTFSEVSLIFLINLLFFLEKKTFAFILFKN